MQAKYDLISLSVLSFLFYGLSWLMVSSGLISKVYHRRFWNSLLLISFIVSGGLGIFLVFQINYDWDIDIADSLTFWHVDVGVVMFWIAFFHIFWHLSYFSKLFDKTKISAKGQFIDKINEKSLKYAALSLGFTAFITQVVIIREFLALFSGNELIIGILFFNWLIITGLGAYIGQYAYRLHQAVSSLKFLLINMAVFPGISLFLMIYLKNKVFLPGTETGLVQIVFYSFLLLIPFNLFSGFLFSLLSYLASGTYRNKKAHFIYAYEAAGSVVAGLLFNFFFIYWLDSFRSLLILLPLNVFIASLFFVKKPIQIIVNTLVIALSLILFYVPLEKFTKEFLFINQKIIYQKNSPYGNVILTENSGQINFYENGNFLFSMDTTGTGSGNIAENEEAVHFAMLQSKHPDRVLLVSGGIEGQLKEILKYPVKQIDYSEINPALIGAAKRFKLLPQSDKINYINTDVRLFLSHNKTKYDVILLNIPPPLTAETNRYYTLEFFRLLKQHLNPKGIIKTQLPSSGNYLSKDAEKSYSVLYATLSAAFEQVNIIPGEKDYFLASDKAIDLNIVAEITERKIESEYVKYYLDDFSIAQRSEIIRKRINPHADINYDFKPVAYPVQIKAQLARFKTNYWILAVFILLFLIFVLRNTKRQNFGMFAVGFASITAELLIIFAFQILYGNVFSLLSVIIMIFMVGLAVGSLYLPKLFNKNLLKQYKTAFILLSLILLVLPVLFLYLFSAIHSVVLNYVLIFLLSLCISTISGYLFYISEQISSGNKNQVAGKIYSADLFGSATGALAVSMFIVPFAGFIFTGIIAGVLSFTAFLVMKNKG